MTLMTCSQMILHLWSVLTRHRYPDEMITDNGTQFSSSEFATFIKHTTSSPLFPWSNGMAECSVQVVKQLVRTSTDPYSALLAYQTTPLENGYSPAQLLYSRQLHTDSPMTFEHRRPKVPNASLIIAKEEKRKQWQKQNFDSRHRAKDLPPLPAGTTVYLPDRQETDHVVSQSASQSYTVSTPSLNFRWNRRHIIHFQNQRQQKQHKVGGVN